jgi:hypothetical protein
MSMDRRLEELLERGVKAVERLAEDPVIEVETKPPVCPSCDRMNPSVRTQQSEGEGKLAEFVIQAECQHCHKVFYGIPVQWFTTSEIEEAKVVIEERSRNGGVG